MLMLYEIQMHSSEIAWLKNLTLMISELCDRTVQIKYNPIINGLIDDFETAIELTLDFLYNLLKLFVFDVSVLRWSALFIAQETTKSAIHSTYQAISKDKPNTNNLHVFYVGYVYLHVMKYRIYPSLSLDKNSILLLLSLSFSRCTMYKSISRK